MFEFENYYNDNDIKNYRNFTKDSKSSDEQILAKMPIEWTIDNSEENLYEDNCITVEESGYEDESDWPTEIGHQYDISKTTCNM